MTSAPKASQGAWTSFKFTDTRSPQATDNDSSSSETGSPVQRASKQVSENFVQDQLNASFTSQHVQDGASDEDAAARVPVLTSGSQKPIAHGHTCNSEELSSQGLSVTDSCSFAYGHMDEDERNGGTLKVKDRKRRNTKMRFSFLMNDEENEEIESKAKPRPSLLDVKVPTSLDNKHASQARQSSVRTSDYFDALEDLDQNQGVPPQLSTITEDADDPAPVDIKTIPSSTQPKPVTKEQCAIQHESQQSFTTTAPASFVSDHEDSFDDMIVLTNTPYATHTLPCTRATATTTTRLKASAFSLMRFSESEAIFSGLMIRLERMLDTEIDIVVQDKRLPKPSLSRLVKRLRDFLRGIKEGRLATGEESRVVEHELRMCEWMVEACREGVMHVRTRKCRCRPDWSGPARGHY